MGGMTKSKILDVFASLDGKPAKYGDPMQHPIFLWLGNMEREHGDALRGPLHDAISETKHRDAAVLGIQFLGVIPGSTSYLVDVAVNHRDEWYRTAAVDALEVLGEREILRDVYDRVPASDRVRVGKALISMDVDAFGGYGPLTSQLIHGKHPGKRWDEAKSRLGEDKSLAVVTMICEHPQLPENIRSVVSGIRAELSHG